MKSYIAGTFEPGADSHIHYIRKIGTGTLTWTPHLSEALLIDTKIVDDVLRRAEHYCVDCGIYYSLDMSSTIKILCAL